MPKSQADKPQRFEYCDVYPKFLKDVFCCEHKSLLCALCSSSDHKGCFIKTVQDVCGIITVPEIGALCDKIKTLQENVKSSLPPINKDISKIKDQQKTLLRDAQMIYDHMTAKLNKLYDDIKKEIQTRCQSQLDRLSHQHKQFDNLLTMLDSPLARLEEMKTIPFDTKMFLLLKLIVSYTKRLTTELQDSHKQHQSTSLTFKTMPTRSKNFIVVVYIWNNPRSHDDIMVPEIVLLLLLCCCFTTTVNI